MILPTFHSNFKTRWRYRIYQRRVAFADTYMSAIENVRMHSLNTLWKIEMLARILEGLFNRTSHRKQEIVPKKKLFSFIFQIAHSYITNKPVPISEVCPLEGIKLQKSRISLIQNFFQDFR